MYCVSMLGVLTLQSQHVSSNSVLLYHNGNLLLDSSDNCAKSLLMKCFGFVWYTSSDIFTFCILSTPFVKPVGIKKLYSCVSMRNNSVRMQGWPLPICWSRILGILINNIPALTRNIINTFWYHVQGNKKDCNISEDIDFLFSWA